MKYAGYGLLGLIAIAVLVVGIWAIRYYTAEPRGKVGAEEHIQSAPFRIEAYNRFFDMCVRVQELQAKLDAQHDQLASASEDAAERIMTNITGLRGEYERAVRQYNADARKDYTVGQFRDRNLPYTIEVGGIDYKNGERTSCS